MVTFLKNGRDIIFLNSMWLQNFIFYHLMIILRKGKEKKKSMSQIKFLSAPVFENYR